MQQQLLLSVGILVLACIPTDGRDQGSTPPKDDDLAMIDALYKTAANEKTPLLARASAVEALGKLRIKDGKAAVRQRSALQGFLNDANLKKLAFDDDAVFFTIHVVRALGNLGPRARAALPDVVKARGYEANLNAAVAVAVQALQAPGPTGGTATKGVKELLADLNNRASVTARLAAAKALGQFADPGILAPLATAAATDPDPDVQFVAAGALKKVTAVVQLNRQQYVAALVAMLDNTNDVTVRMVAAKTLGSLGNDALPAVAALTAAAGDPDPDLRSVAANALKRIRPK
jgi:HEAT repeat protein